MRLYVEVLLVVSFCSNALLVMGEIGTARSYDPPYLSTKCPGYDNGNLPVGGMFAAAGNLVWDNGAACGRKYQVTCLSGPNRPCKEGIITVEVVDRCRNGACYATLVLAKNAYNAISKNLKAKINIEYAQ
ncbi:EG45-like domain containing protein [Aristolochia californica]|uniref:EG45-like domain containing protein n=1 Tax=Aristolochia californica TaxID=171875 RepID=UPI0035DC4351